MCTGLDEAILGFASGDDPEADGKLIEELLTTGAHQLAKLANTEEAERFVSEDVEQVRAMPSGLPVAAQGRSAEHLGGPAGLAGQHQEMPSCSCLMMLSRCERSWTAWSCMHT
jgi:hypothetical protein